MELLLRFAGIIARFLNFFIVVPLLSFLYPKEKANIPKITNDLLKVSAVDLAEKIRNKEVKSETIVKLYIERLRAVNKIVNAVVDERYNEALEDAKKADQMCETMTPLYLLQNYPLLGVPFTVKESIAVKGLMHTAGSMARLHEKADKDSESVRLLRAAGGIPLCVSNTPEWCMAWESYNHITGRTLNPYDLSRTAGGSSGGEAALIGAGASLFGPGSDIGGSIRIPALFTGIFGHKPTSSVISIDGHFPYCKDPHFQNYLAVGPMCRYAKDLYPLVQIMSGENAKKLRLDEPILTKDIKIFFKEDVGNNFSCIPIDAEIRNSMKRALDHFQSNGLSVQRATSLDLTDAFEMCVALLMEVQNLPDLLGYQKENKVRDNALVEMAKCLIGRSQYTFAPLSLAFLNDNRVMIPEQKCKKYLPAARKLRQQFIDLLGEDGVFFYPTYCKPAVRHYESLTTLSAVPYTKLFNVFGFPACHVPMGLNSEGLPIGFQVVAAPYQDRLCLAMAVELEHAFGGWVPPS
ncbi:fatty-acid amide hydrolase 2-B-like [Culicoides brevitarsis]|uniref:fatty-acid amide hydrolase 2-B-like n=1 Tax=Culicoides brevitarsis TaxID=469753 RepID=UPI00307BF649